MAKKGPNAGRFVKGDPRAGRPKGRQNNATIEARAAASEMVDDPIYRAKLMADLRKRKVAPAVEALLWHYAKGKPVERHEVGEPGDFGDPSQMTDEQLEKLALDLAAETKALVGALKGKST